MSKESNSPGFISDKCDGWKKGQLLEADLDKLD